MVHMERVRWLSFKAPQSLSLSAAQMRFLNKTFTDIKKNWNIYTEEENNQDGTVYKHKYYI